MTKTGRPPKYGKKGKLIGITIPIEDYDQIREKGLDAGLILHNALNVLEAKPPKPIEDTLTVILLAHWQEYLDHVNTLTGSRNNPFNKLTLEALEKDSAWWKQKYQVQITNKQLKMKWKYLGHASQQLKH